MDLREATAGLTQRIEQALSAANGARVAVGIDGRCGAGKSMLAASLSAAFSAPVVHMDDFFLPGVLRTPERLMEPGGNVHYERFLKEVVPRLKTGEAFGYGRYDCSVGRVTERVEIPAGRLVFIEGAYAFLPRFGACYDIRVFVTVDSGEQVRRIRARNGEAMLRRFRSEWIPMEERYIAAFSLPRDGDIVLDTTAGRAPSSRK